MLFARNEWNYKSCQMTYTRHRQINIRCVLSDGDSRIFFKKRHESRERIVQGKDGGQEEVMGVIVMEVCSIKV
jgi:hypothetical protein